MHKNLLKTFLQHIAVVLCKKRLKKQAHFLNIKKWPPSKGYTLGKILTLGQKLRKNMLKILKIAAKKNGSKKTCIHFSCSMRQKTFWKWEQKWPPSKGYRLAKILTLGQKLKMHKNMLKTFLQHIAVVLCKKRLQKTANIRKMRAFWKLPKMATKQRL